MAPFFSSMLFIFTSDIGKMARFSLFPSKIICKSCRNFSLLTKGVRDPAFRSVSPPLETLFLILLSAWSLLLRSGMDERRKPYRKLGCLPVYEFFSLCIHMGRTVSQTESFGPFGAPGHVSDISALFFGKP